MAPPSLPDLAEFWPQGACVLLVFLFPAKDAAKAFSLRGRQRGASKAGGWGGEAGNEVSGLDGPGRGCEGSWAPAVRKVGASEPGHSQPQPAVHPPTTASLPSPPLPAAHTPPRPDGSHQASSMWQFHPAHQAPFPPLATWLRGDLGSNSLALSPQVWVGSLCHVEPSSPAASLASPAPQSPHPHPQLRILKYNRDLTSNS